MKGNGNHIKQYSARDIEKYLNGQLSGVQMHDLERAAMDDPILADAIEGMEKDRLKRTPAEFRDDLAELSQQLQKRVRENEDEKAIVPLYRSGFFRSAWKVAAVFILLAGSGWTAWYYLLNKPAKEIAATRKQPAAATTPASAIVVDTNKQAPNSTSLQTTPLSSSSERKYNRSSGHPVSHPERYTQARVSHSVADPISQASPGYAAAPQPPLAGTLTRPVPGVQTTTTDAEKRIASNSSTGQPNFKSSAPPEEKFKSLAKQMDTTAKTNGYYSTIARQNGMVNGIVLDNQNKPIPGANVYLKNYEYRNTVTDNNGAFHLKLPGKESNYDLQVKSLGFQDASVTITPESLACNNNNNIRLQPQPLTLNEVVVSGYGTMKKSSRTVSQKRAVILTLDTTAQQAVPVIGWAAYQTWLETNQDRIIADTLLLGNQSISFRVNRKGKLSSFTVDISLSPAQDSATISLIKQGPAWRSSDGKATRAAVILSFHQQ